MRTLLLSSKWSLTTFHTHSDVCFSFILFFRIIVHFYVRVLFLWFSLRLTVSFSNIIWHKFKKKLTIQSTNNCFLTFPPLNSTFLFLFNFLVFVILCRCNFHRRVCNVGNNSIFCLPFIVHILTYAHRYSCHLSVYLFSRIYSCCSLNEL